MADKQKIKGNYAYKCQQNRLIEIDSTNKDCSFLFSNYAESKPLFIECDDCPSPGTSCFIEKKDIGRTVLPLYKGKFKVYWKE